MKKIILVTHSGCVRLLVKFGGTRLCVVFWTLLKVDPLALFVYILLMMVEVMMWVSSACCFGLFGLLGTDGFFFRGSMTVRRKFFLWQVGFLAIFFFLTCNGIDDSIQPKVVVPKHKWRAPQMGASRSMLM